MWTRLRHMPLPSWHMWIYYLLLIASLYFFAELAEGVYSTDGFAFDSAILTWFNTHRSPVLTRLALALDVYGISYLIFTYTLIISALVWRHSRRAVAFLVLSVGGIVFINLLVKGFFERVRPDLFEQLTPVTNFSFPSGHTMGSSAFALAIFFVVRQLAPRYQGVAGLLGAVFALSVGLSRSYLQVHYPSDILAGWALAVGWVLILNAWYTGPKRRRAYLERAEARRARRARRQASAEG